MTDFKQIARRNEAHRKTADQRKNLRLITTSKGLLAVCSVCPRYHVDVRKYPHPVFSQAYGAGNPADAYKWFQAHQCTDMHLHYLNPPTSDAPFRERSRAQQRGEGAVTGKPVPFPHAADRRNLAKQERENDE